MSALRARLQEDLKKFMKERNEQGLLAVRNAISEIKKREIDQKILIDDTVVQSVISGLIKARRESIEQYKAGNRTDLVAQEQAELNILEQYMPAQMSDDELQNLVMAAVKESGAKAPKDQGLVMKALMPKIQGRAEGVRVKDAVAKALGNPA